MKLVINGKTVEVIYDPNCPPRVDWYINTAGFQLDPPLGRACATEPHYSKSELKNARS